MAHFMLDLARGYIEILLFINPITLILEVISQVEGSERKPMGAAVKSCLMGGGTAMVMRQRLARWTADSWNAGTGPGRCTPATATALVYPAGQKQGEHASIRTCFLNSHFLVLQNKLWKDVNI
jgi:hypothetical protein